MAAQFWGNSTPGAAPRWEAYVRPGEQILWTGRPDVRAYAFRSGWALVPFGLLWTGFVVFWEWQVVRIGAPLDFLLPGAIFVLIGLGSTFGPFGVAVWQAHHTFYALTAERVLIRAGGLPGRLTDIALAGLPYLQLDEGAFGIGTISFGSPTPLRGFVAGAWVRTPVPPVPAFRAIPHAWDVYALITRLRDERQAADSETRRLDGDSPNSWDAPPTDRPAFGWDDRPRDR